jgi:hypothetical protein
VAFQGKDYRWHAGGAENIRIRVARAWVWWNVAIAVTGTGAMKGMLERWNRVDRDGVAAALSVVPGLGHLYKHHYSAGFGILIIGNVLVAFVSGLLFFATLGISLILIPAAWIAGVALAAGHAADWHGRHRWPVPWREPHRARLNRRT